MAIKMHPDDVKARDWEFVLSERFPSVPTVSWGEDWPPGDDNGWIIREFGGSARNAICKARAKLINAWPSSDDGETIEKFITELESAFERKAPAVSDPPRGESGNTNRRRKRSDWGSLSPYAEAASMKLRERRVCERFAELGISVRVFVDYGEVSVELLKWDRDRWSIRTGTVMSLTAAEMWLDHHEPTVHTDDSRRSTWRRRLAPPT